jgi:hypothetical protein
MPFIPTPGIVQANLFFEGVGGVFAQNRLYFAASTVPTSTDMEEIDDALYPVIVAQYTEHMSSFWQLDGITYRAMNEAEGLELVSTQTFPVEGASGDTEMEGAQVSYTITLNTGLAGRSARGRVYGVGLTNAAATGNRLTTAAQGVFQAAWAAILSAMELSGHALQVVSFFEGGVARSEGRPLSVLSANVRFPLATQRRRLS